MLVETNNLVSAEEFQKDMNRFVQAVQSGGGPIAVTRNSEVVGFFVSAEEYERMFGAAVKKLLAQRSKGPRLSQEEAKARIRQTLRRARKA